jgi:hypothetical protein
MRRDFATVLSLIRANAILHQANRERDAAGAIIATIDDYAVVRALVADLIATAVEAAVRPQVRETVEAVRRLLATDRHEVSNAEIVKALALDKSTVSRRVKEAVRAGYLRNLEDRPRRPPRLVLGDSLPADKEVLPAPQRLRHYEEGLRGCAVAGGDMPAPTSSARAVAGGGNASFDLDWSCLL